MKTKLNLLFSTPVVSITEPYDLSDEEKNYLTVF